MDFDQQPKELNSISSISLEESSDFTNDEQKNLLIIALIKYKSQSFKQIDEEKFYKLLKDKLIVQKILPKEIDQDMDDSAHQEVKNFNKMIESCMDQSTLPGVSKEIHQDMDDSAYQEVNNSYNMIESCMNQSTLPGVSKYTVIMTSDKSTSTQMIGSKFLTDFENLAYLGNGRYSIVIKVAKKFDKNIYAIKKIKEKSIQDSKYIQSEIDIISKVNHPNIVRYYDAWQERDDYSFSNDDESKSSDNDESDDRNEGDNKNKIPFVYYFLMEFCDMDLKGYMIDDRIRYDISHRMTLIKQILKGLTYLHENKIIHRDIKPENILVCLKNLTAKVTDFGFSKMLTDSKDTKSSQLFENYELTANIGTKLYAAPEIFDESDLAKYNEKADIYSLGIVIFEMCHILKSDHETQKELSSFKNRRHENENRFFMNVPYFRKTVYQMIDKIPENRPSTRNILKSELFNLPKQDGGSVMPER